MPMCLHGVGWSGIGSVPCLQCDQIQRELEQAELVALRARVADLETSLRDSADKLQEGVALAEKLAEEKGLAQAALRSILRECEAERGHSPEAGLATVYQIVCAGLAADQDDETGEVKK